MTLLRTTVVEILRQSLADLNAERDPTATIVFSEDLVLLGVGSPLDSLDFLNFTVNVEDRLQRRYGMSVNLAALLFASTSERPFDSVAALADHLSKHVAASPT